MKSYRMKFMAILLALLMCVCLVDTHALVADETNGPVYESGDLTYTFTLQGSWNSGYNASIRIDNHSAQPIEDWRFEMEYAGSISNIWNAVIESNADGKYIIKNAGWNQDIAAGSYVEFGLSGAEAFDKYPSSYTMLTGIAANSSEDFTAVFEITNDWTQGFTGRITITNNTDAVIEDWVLEFDGENEISTLWDGQIVSHEGTHYIVKSADYNQNIPVGGSVSFNFNVDFRSSDAEFTNFALSSYADLSQQTNPGGDDTQEPGSFDDIGEIYIKEPSPEDFVTDQETGLIYVRNQLLISAFMGLEKSVIEDICQEIGASIVGYIELTNDYQIEFNEDKTLNELSILADYINSYSFISNVTLNLSCPTGEEATTSDTKYSDDSNDSWSETNPSGDPWALATLYVFSAWDYKDTFVPVRVGVYDGGFTRYHEDLVYSGYENSGSDERHGTHVAGIIAASHDNGKGISGVATDAKLYVYGTGTTDQGIMGAKKGYALLIGNHVKVINHSAHIGTSDELSIAASHTDVASADFDFCEKARNQINSLADDFAEFLRKFIIAGYDFVICNSAGNRNNLVMMKDYTKNANNEYNYTYGVRVPTANEASNSNIPSSSKAVGVDCQYNSILTAITDDVVKERIIIVGNLTKYNTVASDSSLGSRVDVIAPGDQILSTVPSSDDPSGYKRKGGTSMASPHVAGIVALMYQANPSLPASRVKRIIKNSSTRPSVSSGGYSYVIPNALKCIEAITSTSTNLPTDITWPSGILSGQTESDGASLGNVSFTAYRKSSGDYNVGTYDAGLYSFTFESSSSGEVMAVLPQGVYDITVYKDGYLPFCIKDVTINPDQTTSIGTVTLTQWATTLISPNYYVKGLVKNAITGEYISGVTVKFRKGWNNETGAYVKDLLGRAKTATTDANGSFSCLVAIGAYTAEISKDGYVTGYYNVVGSISGDYTIVISPVLSDDEYRIVLTWGSTPYDLDSHLTYYVNDTKVSHVYYSNKSATYQGQTIAVLDLDDTTSYGPETVTITLNSNLLEGDNHFCYLVHDFSNRGDSSSKEMSMSDAAIHVYQGNELLRTYLVPLNKAGTVWHVFDIDKNGIHTINEFSNESDASNVG